jgi:hypothetical protein
LFKIDPVAPVCLVRPAWLHVSSGEYLNPHSVGNPTEFALRHKTTSFDDRRSDPAPLTLDQNLLLDSDYILGTESARFREGSDPSRFTCRLFRPEKAM